MRPAYIDIDVNAFTHNLAEVRRFAPQSKILAMIKANAYGHGIKYFIAALQRADAVGVACIEEAIELRKEGLTIPILLLEGFFSASELSLIVEHNLMSVIHNQHQINILQNATMMAPIKVWLKLDTGMHRLGIAPSEFNAAWAQLINHKNVAQPPVVMSHFACADEISNPFTSEQLAYFHQTTPNIQNEISLANSAAIITRPETHYQWVRPGIMLYGISPFTDKTGDAYGLKPVMTLRSEIIALRHVKQGETVGYGAIWTAPKDSLIGVVGIGYADGYPRHAKNGTPVLVNGHEVPLVGRVSMDMLTVDLSNYPETKIGSPVTLWGKGLAIEKIAQCSNTIAYELVCGINRTHRVHQISA